MLLLLRAPNLSRYPIFAAAFLCAVCLAFTAAQAGPVAARPAPSLSPTLGAALSARSGPFEELYFAQVFGKSPFDRVGLYEILVESREAIKKESSGAPAVSGPKTDASRRAFLSGAWQGKEFEFFFGRRQRPGPDSAWDLDPNALSLLPDVSHGRATEAVFARAGAAPWLPGLFWMRGASGAGVYFADRRQRFRLAWHPVRREGALALDLPLPFAPLRSRLFADVVQQRGEWSGYLRAAGKDPDGSRFLAEAERRLAWDEPAPAWSTPGVSADRGAPPPTELNGDLPLRRGRSGAVAAFVQWQDFLQLEAAGLDRGYDAYRVAGAAVLLPPGDAVYLALRVRYYEQRDFRPAAAIRRFATPAAALGLGWRQGAAGLSVYAESRSAAAPLVEIEAHVESAAGRFGLAAAYSREREPMRFLFLRSPGVLESGARYYAGRGALRLYLQADWLYFGAESRVTERGFERSVFVQARIPLD